MTFVKLTNWICKKYKIAGMIGVKKYEAVAETIKRRIIDGKYKPQTLLPNQDELAQEFNVSKITIKSALDHLAQLGLVYKKSGMGTCVLGNISLLGKHDSPVSSVSGLSAQQGKEHVTSKVIKFDVAFPSDHICQLLNLKENQPVYEIVRLRLLDKEPFILEHTFMPVNLVPSLSEDVLHHSIYAYMKGELGIKFGGAYRKIKAAVPDQYDIKYLGATEKTPILEVEQIVWTSNGVNIEYSSSHNLYDKRSYTVVETK